MSVVARPSPTQLALVLGLTMRLTRFVVADELGELWIKDPLDRAAHRWWTRETTKVKSRRNALRRMGHNEDLVLSRVPDLEQPWWWKYRSGLDCPFCVGFWIGTAVLASEAVAGRSRWWKFGAAAFTLNEVAAHLGARLGDTAPDDEESE